MTNATHARFLPRALPVRSTAATGDARSQMSETDRPAHRSQCGTAPLRSRGAIVRRSSADLLGQATGAARRATHGNEPAGFHADGIRARCRSGYAQSWLVSNFGRAESGRFCLARVVRQRYSVMVRVRPILLKNSKLQ